MKQFKVIFIALFLWVVGGQIGKAQVFVGPEAGITFGQWHSKILNDFWVTSATTKPKLSYTGGINFRIFIIPALAVRTGIFYERMAFKWTMINDHFPPELFGHKQVLFYQVNYGKIPLQIAYFQDLGSVGKAFVGAGGYVAHAFSGTRRFKGADKNESIKLGNGQNNLCSPFDFGLSWFLGYQSPFGLYLRLGYHQGLKDLYVNKNGRFKITSSGINITIGYGFQLTRRHVDERLQF